MKKNIGRLATAGLVVLAVITILSFLSDANMFFELLAHARFQLFTAVLIIFPGLFLRSL